MVGVQVTHLSSSPSPTAVTGTDTTPEPSTGPPTVPSPARTSDRGSEPPEAMPSLGPGGATTAAPPSPADNSNSPAVTGWHRHVIGSGVSGIAPVFEFSLAEQLPSRAQLLYVLRGREERACSWGCGADRGREGVRGEGSRGEPAPVSTWGSRSRAGRTPLSQGLGLAQFQIPKIKNRSETRSLFFRKATLRARRPAQLFGFLPGTSASFNKIRSPRG